MPWGDVPTPTGLSKDHTRNSLALKLLSRAQSSCISSLKQNLPAELRLDQLIQLTSSSRTVRINASHFVPPEIVVHKNFVLCSTSRLIQHVQRADWSDNTEQERQR